MPSPAGWTRNGNGIRGSSEARSSTQSSQNDQSVPRIATAYWFRSGLPATYIMLARSPDSPGPQTTRQPAYADCPRTVSMSRRIRAVWAGIVSPGSGFSSTYADAANVSSRRASSELYPTANAIVASSPVVRRPGRPVSIHEYSDPAPGRSCNERDLTCRSEPRYGTPDREDRVLGRAGR